MLGPIGGSNGQWVRARNPEGARSFLAEQQMDSDRRRAAAARDRDRLRAVGRWVKLGWRKLRRR